MPPGLACSKARRIHRSISAGKLSFPRVANGIKAAKEEFLGFFHLVFLVIHLLEKSPFWAVLWDLPHSFPVLQQDPFGGGMDPALGWEALGQERNKIPGFGRRTGSFHGNSSRSSSPWLWLFLGRGCVAAAGTELIPSCSLNLLQYCWKPGVFLHHLHRGANEQGVGCWQQDGY